MSLIHFSAIANETQKNISIFYIKVERLSDYMYILKDHTKIYIKYEMYVNTDFFLTEIHLEYNLF